MNLDDQLRAVLKEEAFMRTATRPDIPGLISGGRARRRRRNAVWAGAAILAAVIVGGGAYGVVQMGDDRVVGQITNQPPPQPLPDYDEATPLAAGTYLVPSGKDAVVSPYTITVPAGWESQHGTTVGKNQEDGTGSGRGLGAIGIESFALDEVRLTDDACTGPETLGAAQTSTAGLVAGLRAQRSGPRVTDPVATTVGGLPATRFDLAYPASRPLPGCRLSDSTPGLAKGALQVWSGYLILFPDESASVYVVDMGGRSQLLVTRTAKDASAADRAELRSMLDSIRFQKP